MKKYRSSIFSYEPEKSIRNKSATKSALITRNMCKLKNQITIFALEEREERNRSSSYVILYENNNNMKNRLRKGVNVPQFLSPLQLSTRNNANINF